MHEEKEPQTNETMGECPNCGGMHDPGAPCND